jgi:putative transposase
MARLPRLTLAGHAHHIIQRGNNRGAIVHDDEDRRVLKGLLLDEARRHEVAVHAYVIMDNHLHLLATPKAGDGIPRLMQAFGRRYVRGFNDRWSRSGTLWEGRYKSTLIQAEAHLLVCMAYIDLNPVRAGMVTDAAAYEWSSHRHYVGQRRDPQLTPHALYWGLGNTPFARESAYAEFVHQGVAPAQAARVTEATLKGWALGDEKTLASMQEQSGRRVTKARAGRPPRREAGLPTPEITPMVHPRP